MALSMQEISTIEAKAADVLEAAYSDKPVEFPVNLEHVAETLGVDLFHARFKDPNAIGHLNRTEKKIYVATDMPLSRTSFTIAHELGHFVLHADKDKDTYWRMNLLDLDKEDEKEEKEANWFAASLLMPRENVLQLWGQTRDVNKLAAFFGVSRTAMQYRLTNLGLV